MSLPTVALDQLDAQALRRLAASRLLATPFDGATHQGGPSDFDLNPGAMTPQDGFLKPAAVLVPICARTPLTVLLTERTPHLSSHAGQIAFPGGRIDDTDADAAAAALREAHEEIGLEAMHVETLGYLDPYRTGTGYVITPVVGLVAPRFEVHPNPAEVADVFEVPLAFLMDQSNHRIDTRAWRGSERRFYAMPYNQHYIWGATAGIIRALSRRLFET